jgi:hypothetical protein
VTFESVVMVGSVIEQVVERLVVVVPMELVEQVPVVWDYLVSLTTNQKPSSSSNFFIAMSDAIALLVTSPNCNAMEKPPTRLDTAMAL